MRAPATRAAPEDLGQQSHLRMPLEASGGRALAGPAWSDPAHGTVREGPPRRLRRSANVLNGDLTVGPDVLDRLGPQLDNLNQRCGVQVTQRRLWQQSWLDINPSANVWAASVTVGGRLDAALVLHETLSADGVRMVQALSPRGGDRLLPAIASEEAGFELARTIEQGLRARSDPWSLSLGPVPESDSFLDQLHARLPNSRLLAGDAIPMVDPTANCAGVWGSDCPCLSTNMQRNLRKARNRLATDGFLAHFDTVGDPGGIDQWLERVWELRCERDDFAGRRHLDPEGKVKQFWVNSLRAQAEVGAVELSLLHIGERLAAYVLALTDESTFRVLEGRFNSQLARYNPGRLLEADVVCRSVCQGGRSLDWMNAVAPEKLVAATSAHGTRWLRASNFVDW